FGPSTHLESYLLGFGYQFQRGEKWNQDILVGAGVGHAVQFPRSTPDQHPLAAQARYTLEYKWATHWTAGLALEFIAVKLDGKQAREAFAALPLIYLSYTGAPSSPTKIVEEAPYVAPVEDPDIDHDGVPNKKDLCPNTAAGAVVNRFGCVPKQKIQMAVMLNFATDSDVIPESNFAELANLANILRENPKSTVTIEGHTDSTGSVSHNTKLSLRRAQSVRRHLIEVQSIAGSRIRAKGYGPTQPIADNGTAEGRFKNRRVLATFEDQDTRTDGRPERKKK
ncbi:MAG: hypothetical protein EOP06_25975, partial [Proteobacteria bacterium]